MYCKIPKDTPANGVRGARNFPCVDVPGKRAATPQECRDPKPYVPLGTNPWYGDPDQILNCPAPGARCDQPMKPGFVDTGANGRHRPQPGARRQVPRQRHLRSAIPATAGVRDGAVQRATTEPLRLHPGRSPHGDLQSAER